MLLSFGDGTQRLSSLQPTQPSLSSRYSECTEIPSVDPRLSRRTKCALMRGEPDGRQVFSSPKLGQDRRRRREFYPLTRPRRYVRRSAGTAHGPVPQRHGMRSFTATSLRMAALGQSWSPLARHGYHTAVVGKNHYGINHWTKQFHSHGFIGQYLHEGLLLCDQLCIQLSATGFFGASFAASVWCDPLATGLSWTPMRQVGEPSNAQTPCCYAVQHVEGLQYPP